MSKKNLQVGNRIKVVRKLLGLNQTELGKILGITHGAISHYELGRVPEAEILTRIAELGNVTVDWLLTGKETIYPEEKEKVDFVKEGDYISPEERELLELLRENKELVDLLKKYRKLKEDIGDFQMQITLSPKIKLDGRER